MNSKKFKRAHLGLIGCLVLLICGLLTSTVQAESKVSANLRAAGGAVGGVGYMVLTGMNKIVNETHPRIRMNIVPGGYVGNMERVNSGEVDLCGTCNVLGFMAQKGTPPMDKGYNNVKALYSVQDNLYYFMFAREDLPVDSVGELLEQEHPVRLCTLSPGSLVELIFRKALEYKDVSWDDIKDWGGDVNFVRWPDGVNLVKDGHADVIFAAGVKQIGWAMELASVRDMKILKWEKGFLDYLENTLGTATKNMPGGIYSGIEYGVDCPMVSTAVLINSNVKDEVAYSIVESLANNVKEYRTHHSALSNFKAEGMPKNVGLPIHSGALKFYKEKGYVE